MSDTLLKYDIQNEPDPIQVSPQTGDPSLATLIIVVSSSAHHAIECKNISFGFLQGTLARDFFSDSAGISTSAPTGWSFNQSGALFTATPDTSKDGQIGPDGLTFVLSNIKVNEQVGTTDMTITEVTVSNTGTLVVPLGKFPAQFEVGDLDADPDTVEQGGSTTLSWSGSSGATYELHYLDSDGNTVTVTHVKGEPNQPLPSTGNYTIDDIEQDTTFYLKVTLQAPEQDAPPKVERFFSVTVAQDKPQITMFQGGFIFAPSTMPLLYLNWNTSNADYCEITGDAHQLNTASTDNSYQIELANVESLSKSYTLTAKNHAGSDTSELSLSCQPALINSGVTGNPIGIAIAPDGTRLYVTDSSNNTLAIYNPLTLGFVEVAGELAAGACAIVVSQDGTRLYVVSPMEDNNNFWVADARTLEPIAGPVLLPAQPLGIAVSPDGARVYLTCVSDSNLRVFDTTLLQLVGSSVVGEGPCGIATSADGSRLYVTNLNNDGTSTLWILDAATLKSIGSPVPLPLGQGQQPTIGIAFSLNYMVLYIINTNKDDPLLILDAQTLQRIGNPIPGILGWMTDIAVSSDYKNIYVTGSNSIARLSPLSLSGGK